MLNESAVINAAHAALLFEVNATPKPGLVDRANSGAHRDMDASHFERSAAAISPFFGTLYRLGTDTAALSPADSLPRLREPGKLAEAAMQTATGGVNTHKGAIFSLGLLAAALGRLEALHADITPEAVCFAAGAYVQGICEAELGSTAATHGEAAFLRYGAGGVRAEAESGFLHIRTVALPALARSRAQGFTQNDVLLYTLLSLIANVPDTNVLTRAGEPGMLYAQSAAANALLQVQAAPQQLVPLMTQLDADFTARNISPGGCADLLACAIFLEEVNDATQLVS